MESVVEKSFLVVGEYHFGNLPEKGWQVEFRLVYNGPLASEGDATDKQRVRRQLHPQLRQLWQVDPHLKEWHEGGERMDAILARKYNICGNGYVPIVTEHLGLVCSLDILFFRRSPLGEVLKTGGDLDNRLKTLFDALRTPTNKDECGRDPYSEDDNPTYTLMSNDALVADLRVEADRLLTPVPENLSGKASRDNVQLVIKVKTRIVDYFKGHPYPHFS